RSTPPATPRSHGRTSTGFADGPWRPTARRARLPGGRRSRSRRSTRTPATSASASTGPAAGSRSGAGWTPGSGACARRPGRTAEDGAPPVLGGLTLPSAAIAAEPVSFTATAFDAWAGLPGGPIWSFGDGVSAAGGTVGHVYDAPGVYPVTLVGIDALGNVSRI